MDTTAHAFVVARYNLDGSADTSFNSNGTVTTLFSGALLVPNGVEVAAVIQPDNKIVVDGTMFSGSDNDFALARYNTDGTLDTSFGTGGAVSEPKVVTQVQPGQNDTAGAIALQANDAIVMAGASSTQLAVVRYTSAGAIDTTFGTNGVALSTLGTAVQVRAVLIQSADQKIVVVGSTQEVTLDIFVARYLPSGSLDASFGTDGIVINDVTGADDFATAAALQADGKLVVAGAFEGGPAEPIDALFLRYNADGSTDASFGEKGLSYIVGGGEPFSILQLPDGGFISTGAQFVPGALLAPILARLMPAGLPDVTWGNGGVLQPATGIALSAIAAGVLTSDGKLIAGGLESGQPSLTTVGFYLARFWL